MQKAPELTPRKLHDGDTIVIESVLPRYTGLEFTLTEYCEDFWMHLGEFVGWGHFSSCATVYIEDYTKVTILEIPPDGGPSIELEGEALEEARKKFSPDALTKRSYVLVAIRPPYETAPSPIVSLSNVLYQLEAAHEAWLEREFVRLWGFPRFPEKIFPTV